MLEDKKESKQLTSQNSLIAVFVLWSGDDMKRRWQFPEEPRRENP